jgi:glutathione S-transferase
MSQPVLYIGNKNYSSWSLRPWLLLRHFGVDFAERLLWLDTPEFAAEVAKASPSRRVPVLHDQGRVIWDSLAICEYANETWLEGRGWPRDPSLRALARSAACEMHSSFGALRSQLPMNRVQALWAQLREAAAGQGDFLCGEFGIVDAMFAPVVIRFRGYGPELTTSSRTYMDSMLALPALKAWIDAGVAEPHRLPKYEALK